MNIVAATELSYEKFNKYAGDLYPEVAYTLAYCRELAEMAYEIYHIAQERNLVIAAHYYQRPEIQELARARGFVGDSLGIALKARELTRNTARPAKALWLCAVRFMGDTSKVVLGSGFPVYMPNHAGCSLVASIHGIEFDHRRDTEKSISTRLLEPIGQHPVATWLEKNPGGIVLSYMNSDPQSKAMSWSVFTSRNACHVLKEAMVRNPGKRVLILPDTFLGDYMIAKALREKSNEWFNPELVETFPHEPVRGLCHVHAQKISPLALDKALRDHPDADVYIHPECGCAVDCFIRAESGGLGRRTKIGSTEEMIQFSKEPEASHTILIATEIGHVYTVRDAVPDKIILPVAPEASCEFMKATTMKSLYDALMSEDPSAYEVTLPPELITKAWKPIERMLSL